MVFYHRDQVINNKDFHLASRGGLANMHPGNKASRQLVRQYAAIYVATKKSERGAIARQLYQTHFQDKRIFVVEREYFLRCIEQDRKTAQQGGLRNSTSRRKLSDGRVQSVVNANGGALSSILALPPRVFLHTGEAFAIDTVDHLLRDEAKKIRRRGSTAVENNQEHDQQLYNGSSNFLSMDGANQTLHQTLECTVSVLPRMKSVASHRPKSPRSSSVGTIVSVSSTDTGSPALDQLPPSCQTMSSTQRPLALEPNHVSWEFIHLRKNLSALMLGHCGPRLSDADVTGSDGLDCFHSPQDFNLWKTYAEGITHDKKEDLLEPISSCVLDNIWSNEQQDNREDAVSTSEVEDDEDLNSLIGNISEDDDRGIGFLNNISAAVFFE